MSFPPRGFGSDHHPKSGYNHEISAAYQHITSIISIFIAAITILGTVAVVYGKVLSFCRGWKAVEDGDEHEHGGAKKTRTKLCIALLCADACIAISWLVPAITDLQDRPFHDDQCQAPGIALATGLRWQYGSSIAIALSTYLALRHPLSLTKRWQEQNVGLIICASRAV